jgi:hypothetical protein
VTMVDCSQQAPNAGKCASEPSNRLVIQPTITTPLHAWHGAPIGIANNAYRGRGAEQASGQTACSSSGSMTIVRTAKRGVIS